MKRYSNKKLRKNKNLYHPLTGEKNMTINEINYVADYTVVWVLGRTLILVFCYLNRNIILSYQTLY